MTKSGLPPSVRKFLRREKARFRREVLSSEEAEKKIEELVKQVRGKYNRSIVVNPRSETTNSQTK